MAGQMMWDRDGAQSRGLLAIPARGEVGVQKKQSGTTVVTVIFLRWEKQVKWVQSSKSSALSVPPYLHWEVNKTLRTDVVSFVTPWTSLGQQAEGARTRLMWACKGTEDC